jgi:hypothetical protein
MTTMTPSNELIPVCGSVRCRNSRRRRGRCC